ncbi:MAG: ABC transporter substrate-binding protein [Proteobacteria bacterium]|nr:ABC transporter substrate-binding protein [Pseudomonadota bacterium]
MLQAGVGCKQDPAVGDPSVKAVSLTLDWVPEPEFGGFYAAREAGAFRAQGLAVDIKPRGQGETWKLVAQGVTDFATTAADQVLIAREQGADVVAIFAVYQTSPQGIMVHQARGFARIDDVFTHPGTLEAEDVTWLKFLRRKFPDAPMKLTSNSPGIATFLANPELSKQCFVTSEPLQARTASSDPQTFLIADAGYNPYTTVVIARGEMVRKDPATIRKMILAMRAGWRAYVDDPAATNAVMGKLNPEMDASTFAASAGVQKPLIETAETQRTALGEMTAARWQTLGQQLVELAILKVAAPAEAAFVSLDRLPAK